jgi:hypothetical protein
MAALIVTKKDWLQKVSSSDMALAMRTCLVLLSKQLLFSWSRPLQSPRDGV